MMLILNRTIIVTFVTFDRFRGTELFFPATTEGKQIQGCQHAFLYLHNDIWCIVRF